LLNVRGEIAYDRIHGRSHKGARQSIPLLAGARVQFRRGRQTSVEPASLDLAVHLGNIEQVFPVPFRTLLVPLRASLVPL
jgi:hypothetical protein